MKINVLAIWLLPCFCEDLTRAATWSPALTPAGQNITTTAIWLIVVGLWMWAVRHFIKDERNRATAAVISSGVYVLLNDSEYLMVPADLEMQAKIRRDNRTARQIEQLKNSIAA
jgi:hypothetical protein